MCSTIALNYESYLLLRFYWLVFKQTLSIYALGARNKFNPIKANYSIATKKDILASPKLENLSTGWPAAGNPDLIKNLNTVQFLQLLLIVK